MPQEWTDRIVGARMAVDSEFEDRLQRSEFSRQEWGLVMTAIEFEIEDADDPERARIVADTDNLPAIMPELDRVSDMSPMGASDSGSGGSGGVFDSVKNALGFGGGENGIDEEKQEKAEQLATEYAEKLQQHLESKGKWDEIRSIASENSEA